MEVQTWEETEEFDEFCNEAGEIAWKAIFREEQRIDGMSDRNPRKPFGSPCSVELYDCCREALDLAKEGDSLEDLVVKIWNHFGYDWKSGDVDKSPTVRYNHPEDV